MPDSPLTGAEREAAIRTRLDGISPHPWSADLTEPHDMVVWGKPQYSATTDQPEDPLIMNIGEPFARVGDVCGSAADCEFIANAPSDVEYLLTELARLRAEQARDREGRIVGLPRGESAARNEICDALAEAIAWLGELGDAADEPTTLDIRREWHLGEDDGSLTVRGLLRLLTTNTADEAWRTDLDELVERTWRRVGKALVAARSVSLSTEATDGE